MRKKILGLMVICGLLVVASCGTSASSPKQCQFVYTFNNPSLGPVNGMQELKVVLKDNQIILAKDTKTGKKISPSSIRGKVYFFKALFHQNDGIKVQYDSDGFPIYITNRADKRKVGGKFFIEISQYYCK